MPFVYLTTEKNFHTASFRLIMPLHGHMDSSLYKTRHTYTTLNARMGQRQWGLVTLDRIGTELRPGQIPDRVDGLLFAKAYSSPSWRVGIPATSWREEGHGGGSTRLHQMRHTHRPLSRLHRRYISVTAGTHQSQKSQLRHYTHIRVTAGTTKSQKSQLRHYRHI